MTYEDLKVNTVNTLTNLGFTCKDDELIKTLVRQHQIIVNGIPNVQEEKQEIKITIIGEGSLDDQPLLGFNLKVQNQDAGDFWINSVEDLYKYLNIK